MLTSLIHIKNWHFPINKHIQSFCLISKSKNQPNCQRQPTHNNQQHHTINTNTHSNKQSRHPLYVHRHKHYLFRNSSNDRLLYYYADTYKPEVDGISWLKKQPKKGRFRYDNDEFTNQQYYAENTYNDRNRVHGQKNYAIPDVPTSPIYKYISITMPAQLQQLLTIIQDEPFNCTLSTETSSFLDQQNNNNSNSNSRIQMNKQKYKEQLEIKLIQVSKTIVEMIKNIIQQDKQFNVFEFLCTLSAFVKKEGIFINFLHRYPVWRRISGLVWEEFGEQRGMLVGIGEKLLADFNKYQVDLDAYNQMVQQERIKAQQIANQKQKEANEKLNAENQQNIENQQNTENQQITPTQQTPSQTTSSSSPNTTPASSPPPPPQPPIPSISTLSTLITNIQLLPPTMYPSILQSVLLQLPKLSNQTLTIFMSECILGDIKLSKQFCQQFHYLADLRQWRCTYRFYYLSFIQHYMSSTYLPLYRVSHFVRFSDILQELSHDYYSIKAFLIWLAKEYEVGRKTCGRFFVSMYNRRLKQIQSIMISQRFNSQQSMTLYNIMSSQYAMGLLFLPNIDNWRKPKQDKIPTSIQIIKKFILNIQNSITPQYIYSIEQSTALQINTNVLQRIKKQLKNILKYEEQFIFEIPTIIEYISDSFFNQNSPVIGVLCEVLQNIVNKLEMNRFDYQRVVKKIVSFLFANQEFLSFQPKKKFISQQIQAIKHNPPTTPQHWLHIFQLSKLHKPQDTTKTIQTLIQTYHIPFIKKQMQQKSTNKNSSSSFSSSSPIINIHKPEYENILCMFNLLQKQYYMERPQLCILLTNFINQIFVYSAKSVLKYKVFWILEMFGKIGGDKNVRVDPEIYAYLWTNLSCFIIYIKKKNKFFLRRGRNFCNDTYFIQTLRSLGQQNMYLSNLKNKDRLKMLLTLLKVYWNKLVPRQIAKLLIIIGTPTQLSDTLRTMLKNSAFTYTTIVGLDYNVLDKFKLHNKTLASALNKVSHKNKEESVLALTNQMDKLDRKKVFKNQEFYEEAMEDPNFTEEALIPQPITLDKKIKMIYNCLRITNKIRNHSTFSVRELLSRLQAQKSANKVLPLNSNSQIDLIEQHKYTTDNDLIKVNQDNQFKLDNIEIKGHYQFVQGWNIHEMHTMFAYQLVDYNMFGDAEDNPYEKILLALAGNYGIIKNLVKGQPFSSTVLQTISSFKIQIIVLGSLVQINQSQNSQNSLFIFYSSPKTSKLHLIYAYILSQIQKNVCIVNQQTSEQQIKQLMETIFKNKVNQSQNDNKRQNQNQQIVQQSQGSYGESQGEEQTGKKIE